MEIKRLKELIEFMNEHKIAELEIEEEGKKIKIRKSETLRAPQEFLKKPEERPEVFSEKPSQSNLIEIKAPMVGTFYRAPAPNSPSYVEVGSNINPGDVVCIIEAMKLMNEIKSEVKGEIVEILIENGEPVEYGQTLFLVKPS